MDFFLSTPGSPYTNPAAGSATVNALQPDWQRSTARPTAHVTPGRTTRIAIIGHSLGAAAVSYVQGIDSRVETVVALDKLSAGDGGSSSRSRARAVKPVVPALGVQSEYGFNVEPYYAERRLVAHPRAPTPPDPGRPTPEREEKTGFDGWRKAGVDTMVIVPRASTHLEYTDISYALPACRYGQDVASDYAQAWLGTLPQARPRRARRLLATSFRYLEPTSSGLAAGAR